MIKSGVTTIDGDFPINPDGGIKCFGRPIGATGVRIVCELTKQILGKAALVLKKLGVDFTYLDRELYSGALLYEFGYFEGLELDVHYLSSLAVSDS